MILQLSTKTLKKKSPKNEQNYFTVAVEAIKSMLQAELEDKYDLNTIETKTSELFIKIRELTTTELISKNEPTEMHCLDCNTKMRMKDRKKRTIKGLGNYVFYRRNFYCETCKKYYRPLDDIINCDGYFSPEIKEAMVLLGQRIPFAEASQYMERLLGVSVNHESIQEQTENVGKKIYKTEKERMQKMLNKDGYIKKKYYPEKIVPKKGVAYLQVDGCMAQTRKHGWKEVRNGILFSSNDRGKVSKDRNEIFSKKYFSVFNSRKTSLEEFKRRTTLESHDFELYAYEKQIIIGDGASWIWDYANMYHQDAIKILDYYHASEYLGEAFQSLKFNGTPEQEKIHKQIFDMLWDGKIKEIISWLHRQKQTEKVKDCTRYYDNHKSRMDYGSYRKQGLDIGSGAIESTNRSVVQVRMKHSGMHWAKKNIQSMVSLRCAYLSGEWNKVCSDFINRAA